MYYRIVLLSGKLYAYKIETVDDDQENIEAFLDGATPVILVNELEDLEQLGLGSLEVVQVEPEN